MSQIMVDGELIEKWHMKPLNVEEGDRVRITFTPPKKDGLREKTGTVHTSGDKDTVASIDIDDAGLWLLKHGAVEICQDGRNARYHGSLIDFEKIPKVGTKVVTESGVVGEIIDINMDTDNVQIQRSFNPTIYWRSFDQIEREVR